MRATFRAAVETGDLSFACYGPYQIVTGLLLRNDPLDAVWRESEMAVIDHTARHGGFDGSASAKLTGPIPQIAMTAGSFWLRMTPS